MVASPLGGVEMVSQMSLFPEIADKRADAKQVTLFALASIKGVGFSTIKALCSAGSGDLSAVWKMTDEELSAVLYDARTPNPQGVAMQIKGDPRGLVHEGRKAWSKYRERGVKLFFRDDADYPRCLLDLPQPPSWLFVEGDASLIDNPFVVGVVGTREPTPQGVECAKRISVMLTMMNAVILSGLAEGVDAVAHQSAVYFGAPTVAVLGHGIDVVFPASTAKIRQDLIEYGGAVVSEYLPGDNYSREKFVMRNRIQAGLSRAVCFVEARERSGTAHTLRFARQLERPVFGVRSGDYRGVAEEDILRNIEAEHSPVFDLEKSEQQGALKQYVHNAFTAEPPSDRADAPRMFRSIAWEVENVAKAYFATAEDLDWLLNEIRRVKRDVSPKADRESKPRRARKSSSDRS